MSTRIAADTKLTYADYCQFPADLNRHEVIDGEHWMSPAPDTYHQTLSIRLSSAIHAQLVHGELGRILAAPTDVQLSEHDIVQPDLIVVRQDRGSIVTPAKIEGVPDLVVEILSPSTMAIDRGKKLRLYERFGVPEYWIVEPQLRVIEQRVQRDGAYQLLDLRTEWIELEQLPGIAVDLSQVW